MNDLAQLKDIESAVMTPPTLEEWEAFLNPLIGALVRSQLCTNAFKSPMTNELIANFQASYFTDVISYVEMAKETIDPRIRASLVINAVASLGATCLGNILEMHKKIAFKDNFDSIFGREYYWDSRPWLDDDRNDFKQRFTRSDTSAAFSDEAVFKRKYSTAEIHKWTANQPPTWLVRMIRKSLAYAQWTVVHQPRPRIRLWNINPREKHGIRTFDVTMDLMDLRMLVYDILHTFLRYARNDREDVPPTYGMLERTLANERKWYYEHGMQMYNDNDNDLWNVERPTWYSRVLGHYGNSQYRA